MVYKHEFKLDEVLTAATPGLEQRFDADLKEERVLQAQHGGSQKLGFTRGDNFFFFFFKRLLLLSFHKPRTFHSSEK